MKPWLSICCATIKPEKFAALLDSMQRNADKPSLHGIEFILNHDIWSDTINVSTQWEDMVNRASADWVFIVTDDVVCETKGWDVAFKRFTEFKPDGIALYWPNDGLFKTFIATFPLVRKDIVQQMLPLPYKHYKMDDTLFQIMPEDRRFFAHNVMFRHNCEWETDPAKGVTMQDGRIYPINLEMAAHDDALWASEFPRRKALKIKLLNMVESI